MIRFVLLLIPAMLMAALVGCSSAEKPAPEPTISGDPKTPTPGIVAPTHPSIDCLVDTKTGVRMKVLVTERGVRCRGSQPNGPLVGDPLKYFWVYFVFDIVGSGNTAWYHIGETPSKDSVKGWIPGTVAAIWNTRISGDAASGQAIRFYRNASDVEELAKTGRTSAEPIALAAPSAGRKPMPWPIAEYKLIEHNGQTYEIARVLFLGEFKNGKPSTSNAPPPLSGVELDSVRAGVRRMKLTFVVDNTASTTQYVPQIVAAVQQVSEKIAAAGEKIDIQFGLVLYRDYGVPELLFPDKTVVKVFPFTSDRAKFIQTIAPLKAATVSSGEWEEAVADGLKTGLTGMQWGEDKLTERAIVLIGDSAGHEPNSPKNPQKITDSELIKLANDKGIRLFALAIQSGEADQQKRQMAQYRTLTSGARGECHPLQETEKIAAAIHGIFADRAKQIEQRLVYIDNRAAGKSDAELVASGRIDERTRCEIVEFFKGADVDLNRLGPGGIGYGTGWCISEYRGQPMLDKKVFIARWELDLLISNLNDLLPRLSAPKDFLGVIDEAVDSREGSFFRRPASQAPNETFDVFLRKKDIPSRTGVLSFTRAEILSMGEDRRAKIRNQLRNTIIPELSRATRDDQLFFRMNDQEFAFMPESLFP